MCLLLGTTWTVRAADKPFIVGNSRLTFITENLVRLEYADGAKFLDDSTLFAVNRTPREVDVHLERQGRKYIFTTPAMQLTLDADGAPFGQNNLRVTWTQGGKRRS